MLLFAALSFAVTGGERGQVKDASPEAIASEASVIIQTTSLLENTVNRLRLTNDCKDTEISFLYDSDKDGTVETNGQDAYYNPNAPANNRCNVFDKEGGGLSFPATLKSDPPSYGYSFGGQYIITGVGTNDYDLVVAYHMGGDAHTPRYVTRATALCNELNQRVMGQTAKIDDSFPEGQGALFTGAYGTKTIVFGDEVGATKLPPGNLAACYRRTNSAGGYQFYQVLIAR